ncbi:hypothetical protein [Micromonospora okii]|uniref:hypothetical protein n=1 Tax=Micromonospora okii TaxID=1182970 RepID=UPI001E63FB73|nr:hypothetical protein [Micromonospora okii]
MSIYARLWDAPHREIADPAEEVETIAAARDGDADAYLRLTSAYVPHLRRAVAAFTRVLPLDDARQAAWVGLMSAVKAFDPARSSRLVSILRQHMHAELTAAAALAGTGFTVPPRTVERFFGILAAADGDPARAADLAPSYAMTRETFFAVLAAVTAGQSMEAAISAYGDGSLSPVVTPSAVSEAEDRVLCGLAFGAVDAAEESVCRLKYGFDDRAAGDELSDDAVGHYLGMSRLKAYRTRTRALGKMRAALCALDA